MALHHNRVNRIIIESLDATLTVLNSCLEEFPTSKIFDIFDQTFPTAFVLSTGYWIFYGSCHGASLCVCGRFGISCRHVRSKYHWIDLQPITAGNGDTMFNPRAFGPVIPTRYRINVDYLTNGSGYLINIFMELSYANMTDKRFHVNFQASYGYSRQCYSGLSAIRFTPNPILKEQYGKYFDYLKRLRPMFMAKNGLLDFLVTPNTMPSYGLYLLYVNVAKFVPPTKISAVPLTEWERTRNNLVDSSTQTDFDLYHWGEIPSTIWKSSNEPPAEFQFKSEFPLKTECQIKTEYPLGIDNSYNVQYSGNLEPNPIALSSIPKPIVFPSIQNVTVKTEIESPPTTPTPLPHFGETFQNWKCTDVGAPQTQRRKRGRPRSLVKDDSKLYSTVAKTTKIANVRNFEHLQIPGQSNNVLDSNGAISDIFEQGSCTMEDGDINFELDLIDQLIKEEAQKMPDNYHQ